MNNLYHIKKCIVAVCLFLVVLGTSGCSTMQKLNPFSDDEPKETTQRKYKAVVVQKVEHETPKEKPTEIQSCQNKNTTPCYGRDSNGECVVW